jgi:hypothetical protein
VKELVIVWDSPIPHKMSLDANCPVIQKHRNLAGDFAAQRNYALSLCTAPWVLALDGDERIDGKGWQEIKEAASQQEINAFSCKGQLFSPTAGTSGWDSACGPIISCVCSGAPPRPCSRARCMKF